MIEHIVVNWNYLPLFNFSMQQNHVPLISDIIITNNADHSVNHFSIEIKTNPEMTLKWTQIIDSIPPGQTILISPKQIQIDIKQLAQLTEKLSCNLQLYISVDDTTHLVKSETIEMLAFDEWSGTLILPELIAAFVTPNHPAISQIIVQAATFLKGWTSSSAFTGYQSKDANYVKLQAAAIFYAIKQINLSYITTPPSYEHFGQRIRTVEQMVNLKMGNCIELSLLYAACLEYIGLNPIIVMMKGHAFLGFWIDDQMLTDTVTDDYSMLSKRIAGGINQIVVVEATMLTFGQDMTFELAVKAAEDQLTTDDNFEMIVDIKRARATLIRPLPLRVDSSGGSNNEWYLTETTARDKSIDSDSYEQPHTINSFVIHVADRKALTKQQYWERKLLDLTLRNTLINFKMSRSAIPIITNRLTELEDILATGKEFQILGYPTDWEITSRSERLASEDNTILPYATLIDAEFRQQRLRSTLSELDLQHKLKVIYRSSKKSLEENGANTLFLAIGLLKWYETKHSTVTRYAPLILLPIDIVRKSSSIGYVIRIREEEAQFNITLLELLKQDFSLTIDGLDPLPKDESGVDVSFIFSTIRHAIMDMPRWDIDESAYIGLFSFGQFVMWNDLRQNSEKLAENDIVASLMNRQLKLNIVEHKTVSLDDISAHELLMPISADSSQRQAIYEAISGQSFVLHGPPGTGKSQTITNMIASYLGIGKRVLFVAEKRAALEVVEERLKQIGLDRFCLELHSNKATKKAILNQLEQTILHTKIKSPERWHTEVDRLQQMIKELNSFVQAMHLKRSFGYSVYECIVQYELNQHGKLGFMITKDQFDLLTEVEIYNWKTIVNQLQIAVQTIGTPYEHSLTGIAAIEFTVADKDLTANLLSSIIPLIISQQQLLTNLDIASIIGLPNQYSQGQLKTLCALIQQLQSIKLLADEQLLHPSYSEQINQLSQLIELIDNQITLEEQIGQLADLEKLAHFDADTSLLQWQQAEMKWFLTKKIAQSKIKKVVKLYLIQPNRIKSLDIFNLLTKIKQWKTAFQQVEEARKPFASTINKEKLVATHSAKANIKEVLDWFISFNDTIQALLSSGFQFTHKWQHTLLSSIKQANQKQLNLVFITQHEQLEQKLGELDSILIINEKNDIVGNMTESYYASLHRVFSLWQSNIEYMKDFTTYNKVKQSVVQSKLGLLVQLIENNDIPAHLIVESFERGLYRSLISFSSSEDKLLKTFNRELFEQKIALYKEMDVQLAELTKHEIIARLSGQLPNLTFEASQNSEAGILQRAIRNGGRQQSIRKLFEQIPNLITRLAPCMLMSPISVAQYLNTDTSMFDVVIFDEASQVATAEAIGALARGKQAIIVGDPKQLPPTSFFSKNNDADDEEEDVTDLESILDDCLAVGMPQLYLAWHYRSKHESLIAFSNANYYDHRLLTFPSPIEPISKVSLRLVEGFYDRGHTKFNRGEANAIVNEIVEHVKVKLDKRSIGVVTFSSIQQGLIEDILDEVCKKDEQLDLLISQMKEPLFVKNLENVQGDERDIILFSVGYGPDQHGKVTMNFGPLNREGGWRRLNVAVSRARYEMIVFSTMEAAQIPINRVNAKGVQGLRAFLDYAQKGKGSLPSSVKEIEDLIPSAIHRSIVQTLEKEGYKADFMVGTSQFRVDIAVYHPHKAGQYMLGILIDGPIYSTAQTARDRDVLRQSVLSLLGWRIYNIWSIEWFEQREKTIQLLLTMIKEQLVYVDEKKEDINHQHSSVNPIEEEHIHPEETNNSLLSIQPSNEYISNMQQPYVAAQLNRVPTDRIDFYSPEARPLLRQQVKNIIEQEAPIVYSLLIKRLLQIWGFTRSGSKIEQNLKEVIEQVADVTIYKDQQVFWSERLSAEQYNVYRLSVDDKEIRLAQEWPIVELAIVLQELIKMQISIPKNELFKQVAKKLGYSRVPQQLEPLMEYAIIYLYERESVTIGEHERIIWNSRQ